MNNKIKALNKKLTQVNSDAGEIESQLQVEWNHVFKDMGVLQDIVTKLQDSQDFMTDEYGEISSWILCDFSKFQDCKQYLKEYMREYNFVECDFDKDSMSYAQGESLIIQDETRHDNGVWLNSKRVIDETEYKEDGEVNEVLRNTLIENYMEKTGFFPSVFRVDYHGNISLVNTKQA